LGAFSDENGVYLTELPKKGRELYSDWNWDYWDAQLEAFSQKAKNDCEE